MTTVFRVVVSFACVGLVCCRAGAEETGKAAALSPKQVVEKALAASRTKNDADAIACLDKNTRSILEEIREIDKRIGRAPFPAWSLFSWAGLNVGKEAIEGETATVAVEVAGSDKTAPCPLKQEDGQWRISFPNLAEVRDRLKRHYPAKNADKAKNR